MGKLTITSTPLDGAFIVETNAFTDERGSFARFFCDDELREIMGSRKIVNINFSSNKAAGTVRGIHTQKPPFSEMKLVRCIRGALFDIIVDLRKDSPTFLRWYGVELSESNQKMLIVPEGFGHSFQTLVNDTDALYATTEHYNGESEFPINPLDPRLNIRWPREISVISEKDSAAPFIPVRFEGF